MGQFCFETFSKYFFLLYQNLLTNKNKSSLGAQETPFFNDYTINFGPKTHFKTKVTKTFVQNCRNFCIFENSKVNHVVT
jgi:hypothetical protein